MYSKNAHKININNNEMYAMHQILNNPVNIRFCFAQQQKVDFFIPTIFYSANKKKT